jgi:uncharacterized protein (DUF58 family)
VSQPAPALDTVLSGTALATSAARHGVAAALAEAYGRAEVRVSAGGTFAGVVPRRTGGPGEAFWQYRQHAAGEAASRIDWRRSGREDRLFVRETERTTERDVWLWRDPEAGFAWAQEGAGRPLKSHVAEVLLAALGLTLTAGGDRCRALGEQPGVGAGVGLLTRLDAGFASAPAAPEQALRPGGGKALFVLASDFLTPLPRWRSALTGIAGQAGGGVGLAVYDPAELSFPFQGRVRFRLPGALPPIDVQRAEAVQPDYLVRFTAQREAVRRLFVTLGWPLIEVRTDAALLPALAELMAALGGAPR